MKLGLVGVSINGLILMLTFQCSCVKPSNTQSINVNALGEQSASNKDLIRQVEIFASSDTAASANAWKNIENYGRQNVIDNLTRLYGSTSPDDYHRVLIAFTFCQLNHEYPTNREVVLSALTKDPPFKPFYGDWAVSLVRRLMSAGDKNLLSDLFEAAEWSDGAMSEELATAYSRAIAENPQTFLQALSSQNEKRQRKVYVMLEDNSLTRDEIERLRVFLKSIPPNSKLHKTAQEAIKALGR